MNIFRSIAESYKRFTGLDANQTALLQRYIADSDYQDNGSGNHVTVRNGLHQDTVYTCILKIANAVSMTPLALFSQTLGQKGRDKIPTHPISKLFKDTVNQDLTLNRFLHLMVCHLLGWGNSFSQIERNLKGDVIGILPMHPEDVRVEGRSADGKLVYSWTNINNQRFLMRADDVLHIRGTSWDGVVGIPIILQLRQLIGRSASREEYQSRFYANGAMLGGVITVEDELTEVQMKRHRESFDEYYRGAKNSGRILLLEGKAKFDGLSIHPRDAEFLETSKMDGSRISAAFGIPSHFISDSLSVNRSSAEQIFKEWLLIGLNPLYANIESQLCVSLLNDVEKQTMYLEFNRESLMQADTAVLIEALKSQVLTAIMTPAEARDKLNLPYIEGTDMLIAPVNYVPLDSLGKTTAFAPAPTTDTAHTDAPATPVRAEQHIRLLEPPTHKRATGQRKGLIRSYKPLLKDAFERIGKREKQDLTKAIKKHLRAEGDSMERWLNDYYAGDSAFTDHLKKTIAPILGSLSHGVKDQVEGQLDSSIDGDSSTFNTDYIDTLAFRYTNSSKNQLKQLLADAPDDPSATLDERLTEWDQGTTAENPTRAEKASTDESTRMVNALARFFFQAGGVQKLVWSGGDCDICQQLDGKVVGIEDSFASAGDDINGMTVESNTFNPPLHQGCLCEINPE